MLSVVYVHIIVVVCCNKRNKENVEQTVEVCNYVT
jgi:hypothetical protein